MKILCITLLISGPLLFTVGTLLNTMRWLDIFNGVYTGLFLVVAGFILFLSTRLKNKINL